MRGPGGWNDDGPGWAASAAVSPNEFYVGNRLAYLRAGDVEAGLMDRVSGKEARSILFQAVGGAILLWFSFGFATLLTSGSFSDTGAPGPLNPLFAAGTWLAPLAWAAFVLLVPRAETLSEWQLLLDGKAGVAESAYAVVQDALRGRQVPAEVTPARMQMGPPVPGVRNFLRIRLTKYVIFVSVFAFGRDLYLGWSMLRTEIPLMLVLRWFGTIFVRQDFGFSSLIDLEPVRALRESVHNALRQGIEAAAAADPGGPAAGADGAAPDGSTRPPETGPAFSPYRFAVSTTVPVFSVDDRTPAGALEPGRQYWAVRRVQDGTVVQVAPDRLVVLRDVGVVQRE
jgi:hypothetical protein